jgi:isoprenylcysteine carboxyl methyltransferase (ICMT) family protein YpbQ
MSLERGVDVSIISLIIFGLLVVETLYIRKLKCFFTNKIYVLISTIIIASIRFRFFDPSFLRKF